MSLPPLENNASVDTIETVLDQRRKFPTRGFQEIAKSLDINLQDLTSRVNLKWTWQDVTRLMLESDVGHISFYFSLERMSQKVRFHFTHLLEIQAIPTLRVEGVFLVLGRCLRVRQPQHIQSLKCSGSDECTNEAFKWCSLCKEQRYCSLTCQVKDWPLHYILCSGGWIAALYEVGQKEALTVSKGKKGSSTTNESIVTDSLNLLRLDSPCTSKVR